MKDGIWNVFWNAGMDADKFKACLDPSPGVKPRFRHNPASGQHENQLRSLRPVKRSQSHQELGKGLPPFMGGLMSSRRIFDF
jgi:hypothetical protein